VAESRISPTEFSLIKKELEAQGELLSSEILERKAQVEQLRMEIAALKRTLEKLQPGFTESYREIYADELQEFNPDLG